MQQLPVENPLSIRSDATATQHNHIVGTLGLMAAQQESQYNDAKLMKEAKSASTVESWIGDDFIALLNLTTSHKQKQVPNTGTVTPIF